MKRLKLLLFGILFFIPITVSAVNGTISVTSANTVVVGNNVTFTVTLSTPTNSIGSWQMRLNYDSSFLKLTATTSEGNGVIMASSVASPVKAKSYTYTFKTLKTGSTNISISNEQAYDWDFQKINLTKTNKTINIITKEQLIASYSKNNNLKHLSIEGYDFEEEFHKDTLEYNVSVPEDVKAVTIKASAEDNKSKITGIGEFEVSLGINTFEVIVRAENGSEKTYKININVIDKNPINVNVDGKQYTVVKLIDQLGEKKYFTLDKVKIDDFEIPSFYHKKLNITLVGLKDSSGEVSFFIYEKNKYKKYIELEINSLLIHPHEKEINLKGYKKTTITFLGEKLEVYKYDKNSKYFLTFAYDLKTGKLKLYEIDEKNSLAIEYNKTVVSDLVKTNKIYTYIIIAFSVILATQFVLIIKSKSKKTKKTDKDEKSKKK